MEEPHVPYVSSGSGSDRPGRRPAGDSSVKVAVRAVAGGVALGAGGLWLLFAVVVLSSRFGTDAATDPHGFGLIFGTILAVPAGFISALALPFGFPAERRAGVLRITTLVFVIASVLLFAAWFTAE